MAALGDGLGRAGRKGERDPAGGRRRGLGGEGERQPAAEQPAAGKEAASGWCERRERELCRRGRDKGRGACEAAFRQW
jgi:hypothetical protein